VDTPGDNVPVITAWPERVLIRILPAPPPPDPAEFPESDALASTPDGTSWRPPPPPFAARTPATVTLEASRRMASPLPPPDDG
jgi:hypothetical protein